MQELHNMNFSLATPYKIAKPANVNALDAIGVVACRYAKDIAHYAS